MVCMLYSVVSGVHSMKENECNGRLGQTANCRSEWFSYFFNRLESLM